MAERTYPSYPSPLAHLDSWEQLVSGWPDPVLVFDSDNQEYLVANDAAVRLLGYTREEILKLQPHDLAHPDDASEIPSVVAEAERDGSVRRPWRALRKDGSVVWTEMTLTRRRIDGRHLSQGLFRVLSDRLPTPATNGHGEHHAADISAKERLKILERTSLAVVTLDRDGVVTYWNAGAADLYAIPAEESIGRQVLDLARDDEDRQYLETLMGQHEQRDEWISRLTVRRPAGEPFEALVTGSAIRTEGGELNGFLFVTAPLEAPVKTTSTRMRRARVQCAACGREVAGTMRRKYCSEKCRQWAYYHRHLDAQRARSRQRHDRRRSEVEGGGSDEAPPQG
jgi:PAS domain S-box-containing protein